MHKNGGERQCASDRAALQSTTYETRGTEHFFTHSLGKQQIVYVLQVLTIADDDEYRCCCSNANGDTNRRTSSVTGGPRK